jgi:hypothetical protein
VSSKAFLQVVSECRAHSAAPDPGAATLQFSQRCDLEYKLAVAREFRDERAFYFPHNVDFRCVYTPTLKHSCVMTGCTTPGLEFGTPCACGSDPAQ